MADGTWYCVVSKGELKLKLRGKVDADGVISLNNGGKWARIVLGRVCERAGLDWKKVQADDGPREFLAKVGMNPDGIEVLEAGEWEARHRAELLARVDRENGLLEASIPGITEILSLADRVEFDRDRYDRQFARMMEDEDNDGANPPDGIDEAGAKRLATLLRGNPRAALYLRAKRQSESGHWSDPTGASGAGRKALELLKSGASIAEVEAAIAVRSELKWD
jgi:hypothetical protein